jgi:thiol-disulfide isomerase/thioredoxin
MLHLLNVKHTKAYTNKYFNEHPHKYNLLGLSQMLSDYGIENGGTIIKDKENDVLNIETPFIAHAGGDFVVVNKVGHDKVNFIGNGLNINVTKQNFCEGWTGVVLLVESNEASLEPHYKKNKKIEMFNLFKKIVLLSAVCLVFIQSYIKQVLFNNIQLTIALIINSIGVFIGYLLVKKQMHVDSEYADKICSLFKQSNCNDVLESKASKFLGVIGWAEIGLGYFISNIYIILFSPQLISSLVIINICVLPYSFWSIWYQGWKAKQWCPLCLIVLGLLWATYLINLIFGHIEMPVLGIIDLISIGCIYIIPLFVINLIIPQLSEGGKIEQITQEMNSLKANDKLFIPLLAQQPYFEVEKSTSNIIFGNPESNILVTILTNPHCNPCAKMHARIEKLLEQTNNLRVQYIFSSFEESLDSSSKFLIAAYLDNKMDRTRKIYSEWFERGNYQKDKFFQKHNLDIEKEAVVKELHSHKLWQEKNTISSTPTILVFGYKLPANYKIEDLKYFKNLDVNSK